MRRAGWALIGALWIAVGGSGCGRVPHQGACADYWREWCDLCDLDPLDQARCQCLEEGILTADDLPDDPSFTDFTDQDAQIWCSREQNRVRYPSSEQAASCRQGKQRLKQQENKACTPIFVEDLGDSAGE